jgi:hypothetical protein
MERHHDYMRRHMTRSDRRKKCHQKGVSRCHDHRYAATPKKKAKRGWRGTRSSDFYASAFFSPVEALSIRQRVDVGDLPYRQKGSLANSKYINPKK